MLRDFLVGVEVTNGMMLDGEEGPTIGEGVMTEYLAVGEEEIVDVVM